MVSWASFWKVSSSSWDMREGDAENQAKQSGREDTTQEAFIDGALTRLWKHKGESAAGPVHRPFRGKRLHRGWQAGSGARGRTACLQESRKLPGEGVTWAGGLGQALDTTEHEPPRSSLVPHL